MFDISKKYWLYIAPYVYFCQKEGKALLYNTQNGASLETDNYALIVLLQTMHEKENLGVILCEGKMLAQTPYCEFITEYCQKAMGEIVDISQMPEKPVQLMPVLNLQNDVDQIKIADDKCVGENVLQNLLELNIYIHDVCSRSCLYCNSYFRQCLCCYSGREEARNHTLSLHTLEDIISQIRCGVVGKLNLLGGDIFNYPYYVELSDIFSEFNGLIHIWSHYAGIVTHSILDSRFVYDVVIPFPYSGNLLYECFSVLKEVKRKVHFYITCIEDYNECIKLIDNYRIDNYSIHPVYVGTNDNFFEEYVYMTKEDILNCKTSFNQIFARQKMNTNNFGKLTILSNGDILAEINSEVLGNIHSDKLIDVVNKEMYTNTAWRRIRNGFSCMNCLYQYLCPSPSAYEVIIGKNNLCYIE